MRPKGGRRAAVAECCGLSYHMWKKNIFFWKILAFLQLWYGMPAPALLIRWTSHYFSDCSFPYFSWNSWHVGRCIHTHSSYTSARTLESLGCICSYSFRHPDFSLMILLLTSISSWKVHEESMCVCILSSSTYMSMPTKSVPFILFISYCMKNRKISHFKKYFPTLFHLCSMRCLSSIESSTWINRSGKDGWDREINLFC